MTKLRQILLCATLLAGRAVASGQDRKILHREEPVYPTIAAKMDLHGTVKLKIWIGPDGAVRRVEYIGGHPVLAESALKAVRAWKFAVDSKESTAVVELKF